MKKCKKCGAIQSADRTLCVDCGELLGTPMSQDERAQTEAALSDTVSDMAARAEDFYVSKLSRALGIVSILAAAVLVVLICHLAGTLDLLQAEIPDGVLVMEGGGAVTIFGTGEDDDMDKVHRILRAQDEMQNTLLWALVGLFCFISAALLLLIPKIVWYLSTLRYRFLFEGEPSPSYLSFVVGKIITYACFAVGAVSLVTVLWRML